MREDVVSQAEVTTKQSACEYMLVRLKTVYYVWRCDEFMERRTNVVGIRSRLQEERMDVVASLGHCLGRPWSTIQ